jgi:hypothetical protein
MQTLFKIILIFIVLLFSFYAKGGNPNLIEYSYQEGFEDIEKNPIKYWVTDIQNPNDINVSYSLDKKSYTDGSSSLGIDISIKSKKSWYYYLQIPLTPSPNLNGTLSFSLDVKINNKSSKDIQIGFNLVYPPYSSGIEPIQKKLKSNIWNSIKIDDISSFTLNHAKSFVAKMYDGNLSDFGRVVSKIVILIRGRGSKKYRINLDNLKIYGTIERDNLFKTKYHNSWSNYMDRVHKHINSRKLLYKRLTDGFKNRDCPTKKYYSSKIDAIFYDINKSLKRVKVLKPTTISNLDSYLRKLKSINSSFSKINLYKMPPMKYYRLDGINIPPLDILTSYNLRATRGEYKSIAILIEPLCLSGILDIEIDNFLGEKSNFSKDNLDFYIAKIWYQAGLNNTLKSGKYLTQELLLKDDSLVKVDYKTKSNYLKVTYNSNGVTKYIRISDPLDKFPDTKSITFNDSKKFKPFKLDAIRSKLLWGIIHIPNNIEYGEYKSVLKIVEYGSQKKILKKIPINIEVLPFELDKSKLSYGLYYTGKLREVAVKPIDAYNKSEKQQFLELKDIKEHGVLYPTSYENINNLEKTLKIREELGFPKDRFYTIGFNVMSQGLFNRVKEYKALLNKYGYLYDSLYVYGIDEASEAKLKEERPKINLIHQYGAKVFTAGYEYTYDYLGNYLDLFNFANAIFKVDADFQVSRWHGIGREIFAYASPQAGVENPEIYRRNFGCKLWKLNFDGAMNWAYQANRGAFWNDFDAGNSRLKNYRDEAFTYPTTDGVVGTIEWEGFREAITDVRYISTLENLRDRLEREGRDVYELNRWINSIDCNQDLDRLRDEIINMILKYKKENRDAF